MKSMSWMGVAVLVPAAFACAAQQQTADGEPTRPGGIEIGYADKEGLGVVPKGDAVTLSGEQQAKAWLKDKPALAQGKWHNEGTKDAYVVMLTSREIGDEPGLSYGRQRQFAFETARLDAALSLAKMQGVAMSAEISTGVSREQAIDYVNKLVDGTAPEEIESEMPPMPREQLVRVEEFAQNVLQVADGMIAGLQVLKVFEGPKDVAIITTWSGNTQRVVEAVRNPSTPIQGKAAQVSIREWVDSIGDALLFTHGCQIRTNEDGEVGLVMFGQSDMAGSSGGFYDDARHEAAQYADMALQRFIVESVAGEQGQGISREVKKSADGSLPGGGASANYSRRVEAAARLASIPVMPELYTAEFIHPMNASSGLRTVCVVKYINVSALKSQDRMAKWMESNAIQDSVVGKPQPVAADPEAGDPVSKPNAKPKPRSSGGQGATGETP